MSSGKKVYSAVRGVSWQEVLLILLIAAFIAVSIVWGKTLAEQSKLRALISEIEDIKGRVANFQLVYDFKPGDFPRASDFWTVSSCGGVTYGANGDGDGMISYKKSQVVPNRHDATIESYAAWCHMSMANMGPSVSVLTDFDAAPIPGVNLPATSIGGVFHLTSGVGGIFGLDDDVNVLIVGMPDKDMSHPRALLTPRQAQFIDRYMDTGDPNSGLVRVTSGRDVKPGKSCIVDGKYTKSREKLCIMAFVIDDLKRESSD
jgi:hypothetical protein